MTRTWNDLQYLGEVGEANGDVGEYLGDVGDACAGANMAKLVMLSK